MIASVNPFSGDTLQVFEEFSPCEIERRLQAADLAFVWHRKSPLGDRSRKLRKAAQILEESSRQLGCIITEEMGKTLSSAEAEVKKCAGVCRFYADQGEQLLGDEPLHVPEAIAFTRLQPLGTVLAIMPWNFPFWQVFRFAAPALMAGNTALLKARTQCSAVCARD